MARLEGKIALVTGAAGGIGRAICARFIEEGARLVAVDLDEAGAHSALGGAATDGRHLALGADITDAGEVQQIMARIQEHFRELHVLCNIAGGSSPVDARVTKAPNEEFWRAIKLDLFGSFLCCKHAIPVIAASGGGAIVNTTSMAALVAVPERDCYTAAKGGIVSLTRSLAVEYAPDLIRVNAIAPGLVLTPRVEHLLAEREELKRLAERHLLGPCRPIDIAQMAVFLSSDEARVVTGQILSVDSGATVQ